ncbi:MAG TPA: alanine glycine permease [Spirochaetaceae bacterium]|nr:alanine glycine permease [Spirochaetaceae bacterium]
MLEKTVSIINDIVWSPALVVLLVGAGLYFSIRTRFLQVRRFGLMVRSLFAPAHIDESGSRKGISSFQAFCMSLSGRVGTGNIVGVATAIAMGGPGAVFWMWIIAFFGMATIYSEAVLAIETRIKDDDGQLHGGPVYYIKRAFPGKLGKFLAGLFAIAAILALGFMGAMVQSNSIGETCQTAFKIPAWSIGLAITIIAALIFLGGIQRIASVTEKLVPAMAILYLLGCIAVIASKITHVPEAFALIFKYAFSPDAIIGGSIGYALKTAISQGVKRGLFSNEAGMGSTPHAHAMANVKYPHEQGVVAMIGLFVDTFIVLTMTALVVISVCYTKGGILHNGAIDGITKTNLAPIAFSSLMGDSLGSIFVAVCLLFFAFSTILGWNFFGKVNMIYLFGKKSAAVYAVISLAFVFLGSILSNDLVWELQDFFNQIIVLPNVIALFAMSSAVVKEARKRRDGDIDLNPGSK